VRRDQEGEEEVVVLMDVPAQQARQDHAVAERGNRERLGDALQQAEDRRLEVADGRSPGSGDFVARRRPGLEPGVGEGREGDGEGGDAVLDVVVVRLGVSGADVPGEEGGQRVRGLGEVQRRHHEQQASGECREQGRHPRGRHGREGGTRFLNET
jgi:hypothetical protein